MMEFPKDEHSNHLVFFLNGEKVTLTTPNPEMTLLTYLRSSAGLTGTKLGCGEGGCGACTVMLSSYIAAEERIVHRAVNACLFPLCAVADCAVTTIEGLGNVNDGLHPVQQRLSDQNGSQCGFCTPGIIMALYAYLRAHPSATAHDIEESFDGNLCRCTGYRPILDAARSVRHINTTSNFLQFANEDIAHSLPPIANVESCKDNEAPKEGICPSTGKPCDCKSQSAHIPSKPLDLTMEPIFPPFLIAQAKAAALANSHRPSLKFVGERATWHTPSTLSQLLALKKTHTNAKIVVGNTEIGIETKFRNVVYPVLVCPTRVPELQLFSQTETGIEIGAALTLTELKSKLQTLCATTDPARCHTFHAILSQLKWFAGNQIRNAACLAGNLITASPISDVNPVLLAADAVLTMAAHDAAGNMTTRAVPLATFFKSYRTVDIRPDEILLKIFVPFTRPLEFVYAYKQSRRRDDDIAIVSCCFRVHFAPQDAASGDFRVLDSTLAYGGMAVKAVTAPLTQDLLKNAVWSRALLDRAYQTLEQDLPLAQGAPGGMIEYRRSLTTSFFFKYFLRVTHALHTLSKHAPLALDARELTAIEKYSRPLSSGEQTYQTQPHQHPVTQAVKHQAADKQVSGEAIYTDDIKQTSYYAAMVMSTKAHANILSVDPAKALAMPGVKGFYAAKDVAGENQCGPVFHDEELFASRTVLCQGYPIGVVVAETHQQALEASKAVAIQYEELPAVLTIDDAIAKNSFLPMTHEIKDGDAVHGLATAAHTLSGEMRVGGQEHFYLETNAALIIPGEGKEFTVYSSTQNPTKTQMILASVLGVPANQVVVKLKRMGGGFGGKETRSIFSTCIAAVAAQKLRHPVRIMLDRDTDMATTGFRHPFLGRYKVGFDASGRVSAAHIELFADAGYSFDLSGGVLDRAIFHSENAYKIDNIHVIGRLCKTNLPTNTAFRGFGGPQGMIICENWIERIANYLNLPVEKVRNNRYKKRGIAIIPTKFGMSFTIKTLNQAGALVHVYTDGTVLVTHGGTEMGQGLHTKIIQIAARELGVSVDQVHVSETSTDKVANTAPTAASVSSDMNGMAVLDACQQINARLAPLREKHPAAGLKQLAGLAFAERINLSANGFYATPNVGYIFKEGGVGEGTPFNYFNYGCACSEVEIDTLTGDHTVLRSDVVMDVGDSLNPTIDIGQVEGAFVQGMGYTTLEELVTFPNGFLFTRGPSTYKIPGFNDVPIVFNVSLLSNAPNPKAIHSSKGVGEPPLFLGSSVYFAIRDAITHARAQGEESSTAWFDLASPATCERIRNACVDRFTKQFPAPITNSSSKQ
uniref:xanthine dehydrogenase n=1 Tax=Rostrostelium ellipticum TaxID=361140 RepID=A0A1L2FUV8_9MYCE|nr:xanthine dehydrogenase [Rostrostelium ellipticum]